MREDFLDADTDALEQFHALVYTPRKHRKRFPETCVTVVDTEAQAREQANPNEGVHAATVCGPARSSEGFRLYYLVCWLD